MAGDDNIESLFREHSLEEIESLRDNLASEIDKRTELLKSIVKEKYSDIVETSDAIQSMKLSLQEVEQSLWSLDKSISEFYTRVKEPAAQEAKVNSIHGENPSLVDELNNNNAPQSDNIVERLLRYSAEIWDQFDAGDLRQSVKLLEEAMHLLELDRSNLSNVDRAAIENLTITLNRSKEMMKNNLWHKVQAAAPDQIGVIAGSDEDQLYKLSLNSSLEFLVDGLRKELSDTSYHAQIRRYQPQSMFNSRTNQIETNTDESKVTGFVQIPKFISPELSCFLFKVCRVVNTIAGFNLNRSSIVDSLRVTIELILGVYSEILPLIDGLKSEFKRRRALQLYFDLLYVRILLNSSKNIDLIEKLDVKITDLASKFELMLDSIELYMISSCLHANVVSLSQSTIRMYGLLIPHLQ